METCDLFAFLTTEPSEPVKSVHPKAMPVILAYRIGYVVHGCIDFRGALVGAVADGAGVACGGCAALSYGLARISLADGLGGEPAGI